MIQKPHTYFADLRSLPKALQHLTSLKRWVVWRWIARTQNGETKWTKPPYQCRHPRTSAKSNDPTTWGTYQEAVAAVAAGEADGIGFMLKDSEVAAADLDHVRDAQTGELVEWVQHLCAEADALELYREITVSGCGLRFIGRAQGNELHRKFTINRNNSSGIELYRNCARYITISGLQQGYCENIGSIDAYLDELAKRFGATSFDFNTAGPQKDYYRDLIENGAPEGERSEKFQEVVGISPTWAGRSSKLSTSSPSIRTASD
jgi:primase-polymerase (primpol)-like protein